MSRDAAGHSRILVPHVTKQVRVPNGGAVTLPFKNQYDKVNFVGEGVGGDHSPVLLLHHCPLDQPGDVPDSVEVTPRDTPRVVGVPHVPMTSMVLLVLGNARRRSL